MSGEGDNGPPSLGALRSAEQRLALARWLLHAPDYAGNEELATVYLKALGLAASAQVVRGLLGELERGGVLTARFEATLMVVRLTQRGVDAAQGLVAIEGMRRPGPECAY